MNMCAANMLLLSSKLWSTGHQTMFQQALILCELD